MVIDNENKRCAGVERIIVNSEAGFMSLNDVESYRDDDGELVWGKPQSEIMEENDITQEDLERTWDMGTLAVRPEYRKTNVSLALYHASNNAARMEGITHWVCIVQNDVLAMFESMSLDLRPFQGVGSGMYLGTPSTPVHLWFGAAEKRAFEENRFTYDFVVKGEGVGFEDTVDFADIKRPKGSE